MFELKIDLESGSRLGLSHLRARQRQQQSGVRVSRDARSTVITPFIDVIEQDPLTGISRFTGLSLADFLADLRRRDPAGLAQVLAALRRHDYGSFQTMSRRLSVTKLEEALIVAPAIPFVSSLAAEIARRGPRKATVLDWRGFVSGLTQFGVRVEEINCTGLLKILEQLPEARMLTSTSVKDHLKLSHLAPRMASQARRGFVNTTGWSRTGESLSYEATRRAGLPGLPPEACYKVALRHRGLGWNVVLAEIRDLFAGPSEPWLVLDHRGRRASGLNRAFATEDEAREWAEVEMSREFASWPTRQRVAKWQKFSVCGGEAYEETLFQLDEFVDDFWSGHFPGVRNVLLHVRWSLLKGGSGEKLLFLEEIQSDWHASFRAQTGEEPGLPIPLAPFSKEWPLLALKVMLWRAQCFGCDGLAISNSRLQLARWLPNVPPVTLYDTTLPSEARALARTLGMDYTETRIEIASVNAEPPQDRRWENLATRLANDEPARDPAADMRNSSGSRTYVVPMIRFGKAKTVRAIPLFGLGKREDWYESSSATGIVSPVPVKIDSRIVAVHH